MNELNTYKVKCDCCNKEVDHVEILYSSLLPASFSYCDDCAKKGFEPYSVLVMHFAGIISQNKWGDLAPYWREIIEGSCEVSGHSFEQFRKDCREYMDSCEHWSDNPW